MNRLEVNGHIVTVFHGNISFEADISDGFVVYGKGSKYLLAKIHHRRFSLLTEQPFNTFREVIEQLETLTRQ
ncbi:hypothetical protein EKN56_09290 [Limnobaculum zhutongyuii]|uniref:Uncharacterized protein n=1 Tax=Limnobaculum zhutongyuii TaxID=2498113 RepID=A0A411WK44_9GAMM|nr:hypothetical protein [Limnobaculum zhutongyuii]QBH96581.1 hypothetical protein EKN56_09290 [Limnobaculum zhutongyuii]TQS90388.1 hypothetical protein ELQ32_03300 [Limnobaculum zhutongyuii]